MQTYHDFLLAICSQPVSICSLCIASACCKGLHDMIESMLVLAHLALEARHSTAQPSTAQHACLFLQANREAPTLEFKSGRDDVVRSNTTAALAAKFAPENDMEEEVAELLRAAGAHTGEAVEEAEEALALQVRRHCATLSPKQHCSTLQGSTRRHAKSPACAANSVHSKSSTVQLCLWPSTCNILIMTVWVARFKVSCRKSCNHCHDSTLSM